jgi:hypothetical protein
MESSAAESSQQEQMSATTEDPLGQGRKEDLNSPDRHPLELVRNEIQGQAEQIQAIHEEVPSFTEEVLRLPDISQMVQISMAEGDLPPLLTDEEIEIIRNEPFLSEEPVQYFPYGEPLEEDEWELDEEVDAELALYEDLWDIEVPGLNLVRELLLLEIEVDELIEEYNALNGYH